MSVRREKVLVICHDAGGAQVISSWVKHHPEIDFSFSLHGPASQIFLSKIGMYDNISWEDVGRGISGYDFVLCGSGWGSDLEKRAVRMAAQTNTKTCVFVDHWNDYRERFNLDGDVVLPDEIWAGDVYAEKSLKCLFPVACIKRETNYFFEDIKEEIHCEEEKIVETRSRQGKNVLYLCEPIEETIESYGGKNIFGYTEYDALKGFLSLLLMNPGDLHMLRIRLHPAEEFKKYDFILKPYEKDYPVEISQNHTLAQDLAWADWVVGLDSMAMAIAVKAGKKVSCSIPCYGRPPVIPFAEIERLFPSDDKILNLAGFNK